MGKAIYWNGTTFQNIDDNSTITLSGDITGSGIAAITTALKTSEVTAGSYGSGSAIPVLTIDSKGRITAASTSAYINLDMVDEMRITPTLERTGTFAMSDGSANITGATVEAAFSSKRNVTLNVTGSGMTTGRANRLYTNSKTGASLLLLAEL